MADTTLPELRGVLHWGTVPVPYVAAWSSETTPVVRADPLLHGDAGIFRNGRRGEGRPILGKMDEARTRRVVIGRLCQVCARPLGAEGYVADIPMGRAGRFPLVHEPPACRRCLTVALARCPGLERRRAHPRFLVARVRAYTVAYAALKPTPEGDPALNAALAAWKGKPPVGYARAVLTRYEPISLADLEG